VSERITRRNLFKNGLGMIIGEAQKTAASFLNEFESTPVKPMPVLLIRPPGALPESDFLEICTRCDACVKICPPEAIKKYLGGGSIHHLTPMIEPSEAECMMCEGLLCISVCEPKALVLSRVKS
jgi:ferredoxin